MAATAALLGLEKKTCASRRCHALRTAITSGALGRAANWWKPSCRRCCRSAAARSAKRCANCSRKAWCPPGARGRLSVRHLDAKEIRDIFSVRAALESLAARTLCRTAGPPARHRRRSAQPSQVMEAATHGTLEGRVESDLDFHRTMCRLTGNETLLHSWESLEGSIRMSIMFAGLEKGVRNMSVDRHNDIVAAIETGDATLARNTIREHMDSAAAVLVA